MRWTVSGLCLASLLGAGSVLALGLTAPASTVDEDLLTTRVRRADLPIEVELKGTFVAEDKDEIRLEPESYRGDLIITSLATEGQAVREGDLLMEFESNTLDDSLEEAGDEVQEKEVEMEKAQADLQSFEIDQLRKKARRDSELERSGKALKKAEAEAALELADKLKSLEDDAKNLVDAEIDFQQLQQLYEERELHTATENILIARQQRQLDDRKLSTKKSRAEFEIWEKYDKGNSIADAQLDHDDKLAEVEKGVIQSSAEGKEKAAAAHKAQRALDKSKKKVSELETDKSSLRVLSPRDGIVFYGTIGFESPSDILFITSGSSTDEMKIGGRVRTHQVLMTVASMENLSVKMDALESDIQHLQEGLPIVISPNAFPALRIDGELTKVDQVASRKGFLSDLRQFNVRGEYDEAFPQLRSGMNCRVTVRADSVPDCLQVPVLAVFSEGGSHHCLVVRDGKSVQRKVEIGKTNGTMVEIQEGLREGDEVALYDPTAG